MPVRFQNDDLTVRNILREHAFFQGHAVHTVEHLRVLAWASAMDKGNKEWAEAFDGAVEMVCVFGACMCVGVGVGVGVRVCACCMS